MNFSAIFIDIARHAVERAHEEHAHAVYAIYEAIVFSWLALEALLNEQAYLELYEVDNGSIEVYKAIAAGAKGFERVQAILTYFYGKGLSDGANPANDLKHLIRLRNSLVHYRFEEPPTKTLDDLAQRGLLSKEWKKAVMISWPASLTKEVAKWAHETARDTAKAIADVFPGDEYHDSQAALIRNNFEV